MTKFKKRLIRGLAAFLLAGAFAFLPLKAQTQEKYRLIMDNFSQPDIVTQNLNWYGSGDVDNNNTINWEDYSAMQSGTQNDRADIDGDGIASTTQDLSKLEEYLNNNSNGLPGQHNKSNRDKKLDWGKKMIEIDKTDEHPYIDKKWECGEFSNQTCINFHGFNVDQERYITYDFSNNGRFNLPIYSVSTNTDNGTYHALNSILVGDNPFNFFDWYFFEPQTDDEVKIGDYQMPKGKSLVIEYVTPQSGNLNNTQLLIFNIDEVGTPVLSGNEIKFKYIVKSNPSKDTIPPEVSVTSPIDSAFYNSDVNFIYGAKDSIFLDTAYYELDGVRQDIDCEVPATYVVNAPVDSISGTIPLTSQEGEHDLVFYASDIAKPKGNETIKNLKFFVDKTPPKVDIIYPKEQDYVESVDSLVFSVSDTYPSDSVNYSINGTEYSVPYSDTIAVNTASVEGQNNYSVTFSDKATNSSTEEVNFNIVPDAVEKKTIEDYFKTYPNPVTDILKFEGLKDAKIEMYSIDGKQLEKRLLDGNEFDMSNYKPGIYILKAEDSKGKIYTEKIIKR